MSDTTGQPVVFRGVNPPGLEFGAFGNHPYPGVLGTNYFTPDLDRLFTREAWVNVVRVPFEWARLVPGWRPGDPQPTALNPAYLALLDAAVSSAASHDAAVLLDMHSFLKYWDAQSSQRCVDDGSGVATPYEDLLVATWRLLAKHFNGNPAVLGFDIQNEPVRRQTGEPCGSCRWGQIAQRIVTAIRQEDVQHLIVVEGPNYSLSATWELDLSPPPVVDAITPARLVYSPHVYFDRNNDSIYDADETSVPVSNWQYIVRDRLDPVIKWSAKYNLPVFFGELGAPCSSAWAQLLDHVFTSYFDPLGMSATMWQYVEEEHCIAAPCPLNLVSCSQNLGVLREHPGNPVPTPAGFSFIPPVSTSPVYGNDRVNPWDDGSGSWGTTVVDFQSTTAAYSVPHGVSVQFPTASFDGLKFMHRFGINTTAFRALKFRIRTPNGVPAQARLFTTRPQSECRRSGGDPEFPSSSRIARN